MAAVAVTGAVSVPAWGATGSADPGQTVGVAGGVGTTAFEDLPVEVRVDRIEFPDPGAAPEGSLVFRGTLVNRTDNAYADIGARLGIGRVITRRSSLELADSTLVPASRDFTPVAALEIELEPDGTAPFRVEIPVSEISASVTGAYPVRLLFSELSPSGTAGTTVGAVQTYLPWYSTAPTPDRVAWVWPLVPESGSSGEVSGENLAAALDTDGRLADLVAVAESVPPGQLTLAVDPALLEAANELSGTDADGSDAASGWLARVRALAAEQPVISLPYADVDVVASVRGGLGADAVAATAYGARVTAAILSDSERGTKPLLDASAAWPPDGALTRTALNVTYAGGTRGYVLSDESLPGRRNVVETAATEITASGGPATGLAADGPLSELVGGAESYPGGPALSSARVSAEMAVIAAGAPGTSEDIVITPPRRWDVDPALGKALIAATTRAPWGQASTVTAVLDSGERSSRGPLRYPDSAASEEIAPDVVRSVATTRRSLAELATVLDPDSAAAFLTPYMESMWSALGSAGRGAPGLAAAAAAGFAADVDELRAGVSVVSAGTYTVSGPETTLPLTVANDLTTGVTVHLAVTAQPGSGFTASDPGPIAVGPQRRLTVDVPAQSERPGRFTVLVEVTNDDGVPLGPPAEISVRSTAYGGVILGMTVGALALFVGLVALRFVRRPGRRGAAPSEEVTGG